MSVNTMYKSAGTLSVPNRAESPLIKDAVDFNVVLPACEKHVLSNGVEVFAVNMGTEEMIMLNWVFYAGNWYEQKKTIAAACNYLLKNGTTSKTAFEINEHFEYYGSYLNRSCYNETSELVLHCMSKHVHELLPVMAEIISESEFRQEELDIYIQNSQQRLKVSLQKCEFVAGRLIDACLFGYDHPYGTYNNLEDYAALKREDLLAFYNEYYKRGRCVLFVAGKLPDNLIAQLDENFGKLPLRKHTTGIDSIHHALVPAAERKTQVINDVTGVQSAIRIARNFPNRHHPDFQKAMVLNNVFGGFFGSRLMGNIREDKGYTYGIYSYLLNHIQDSGWMISTEAGRDVTPATIEEIYKEMRGLREELIDDEELLMTRNYMIGTILGDLDGPFQVSARWKNLILNGLDEKYFYQGIDTIKKVSANELLELANTYLKEEDFYELIVV
ncbi:MAG TPA: pitrilysin family protein [Flavitalea sp.]|nr:pitrilysin family protein [Flavitalea sp.]